MDEYTKEGQQSAMLQAAKTAGGALVAAAVLAYCAPAPAADLTARAITIPVSSGAYLILSTDRTIKACPGGRFAVLSESPRRTLGCWGIAQEDDDTVLVRLADGRRYTVDVDGGPALPYPRT